jgi:GNAT superfamily N-acetyltransferase
MRKELNDGLILRSLSSGTSQDKANLTQFYVDVFTEAYGPEDEWLGPWCDDLLSDKHPTITDDDIWVVVDPAMDDQIVSATLLIPQTWRYEDIEFPVGRVELVATHKEYRHRGLVRQLFEAAHQRSEALGHNVQAITGIPYFYRQFGYAMAVDLGASGVLPFQFIPKLKDEQQPKFTLRSATMDDIPQIMKWEQEHIRRYALTAVRSETIWEYEMSGRSRLTDQTYMYHIIVDMNGQDVGYVGIDRLSSQGRVGVYDYVVGEETSYLATFDDVLRGLQTWTTENAQEGRQLPHHIRFSSGIYDTLRPLIEKTSNADVRDNFYAWYLRVADLPQLVRDFAPVLEKRLESSLAHRLTDQIHISFHSKKGLRIKFEDGKVVEVDDSAPEIDKEDAAFPFHTFLNIVFGHRTIQELQRILPDAYANRKGQVVLGILFPKRQSWLVPLA